MLWKRQRHYSFNLQRKAAWSCHPSLLPHEVQNLGHLLSVTSFLGCSGDCLPVKCQASAIAFHKSQGRASAFSGLAHRTLPGLQPSLRSGGRQPAPHMFAFTAVLPEAVHTLTHRGTMGCFPARVHTAPESFLLPILRRWTCHFLALDGVPLPVPEEGPFLMRALPAFLHGGWSQLLAASRCFI